MPNEQLIAYIREEQRRSVPREEIIRGLLGAGWNTTDINAAIAVIDSRPNPSLATSVRPENTSFPPNPTPGPAQTENDTPHTLVRASAHPENRNEQGKVGNEVSSNAAPLPSFGELFGGALSLYRAKWRMIVLFAGIEFLLYFVVLANQIFNASTAGSLGSAITTSGSIIFSVLSIVCMLLLFLFEIAVFSTIQQKDASTVGATLRRAAGFYLSFVLLDIEFWFVPLGYFVLQAALPALAVGVLVYGAGFLMGGLAAPQAAIIAAAITVLILGIIVSIRLFTYFVMAPWELLDGNHRGVRAFMASRAHVEGNFWAVLGRLILAIIVGAVAYAIVYVVALLVSLVIPTQALAVATLSGIVMLFQAFVLIPIGSAFMYRLYEPLRDRRSADAYLREHSPWLLRGLGLFGFFGGLALLVGVIFFVSRALTNSPGGLQPSTGSAFETTQGNGLVVTTELDTVRTQAEIDYNNTGAYSSSTAPVEKSFTSATDITSNFPTSFLATDPVALQAAVQAVQGTTGYAAFSQQSYAITVPITTQSTPVWYCIDSSGVATATPTSRFTISGSNVACP